MAQDPYGYPPATTATGNASVALWASFAALALALVGPCTCHCTSLIAIPIGAYGVWTAIGAREGGSSESREMATVSLVGGTMATLWSLLWVAFISLYIGIYIFVIAFMVAAGGMNQ